MAKELPGAAGGTGSEPPTLIALILEMIALRHQIAVLKRSGTGRPLCSAKTQWLSCRTGQEAVLVVKSVQD
jgi:hypothetical protein